MPVIDHQRALPFQVSHKVRNTYLRRYAHAHMYMNGAHGSFYDFHPLYLHNVLSISRTSSFNCPNNFFSNLGMNTIWYWHFHLVCDKLLLFIWTTSYSWDWLATPFSYYHRRLFYNILFATAYSILPSIAGGLAFSFSCEKIFPPPYTPWRVPL